MTSDLTDLEHQDPLAEGPVVVTSSKPDVHAHLAHTGTLPFPRTPAPAPTPVAPTAPAIGYDPTAEPGDANYREPVSDAEADARASWLADQYRAARATAEIEGRHWHPELEHHQEIEEALFDAYLDADLSARAHDDDPGPARRIEALEALRELRPAPAHPEHELADEHAEEHDDEPREEVSVEDGPQQDPALQLEDQWFRASLDDVVPIETPDRDAVLARAVDHARTRFVEHGETTWPEQALAATRHQTEQHPEPEPETETETEQPEVEPELVEDDEVEP